MNTDGMRRNAYTQSIHHCSRLGHDWISRRVFVGWVRCSTLLLNAMNDDNPSGFLLMIYLDFFFLSPLFRFWLNKLIEGSHTFLYHQISPWTKWVCHLQALRFQQYVSSSHLYWSSTCFFFTLFRHQGGIYAACCMTIPLTINDIRLFIHHISLCKSCRIITKHAPFKKSF